MTAQRWLSHGDWATAHLSGVIIDGSDILLAPGAAGETGTARLRKGVALLKAGRPDAAQINSSTADRWRQISVRLAEPLPDKSWFRLWTLVATTAADPPLPGLGNADDDRSPVPTPGDRWRAGAVDALNVRVLCAVTGTLWVALELGGDGSTTPRVADLQVDTADNGPVTQLPTVYRESVTRHSVTADPVDIGDGVLGRYLGLLDTQLRQTSSLLDELPMLLNPAVAPDRDDSAWLRRLASWVALETDSLPAAMADRRETISTAAERHGRRGTRQGLLDAIRRETGLTVEVVEPLELATVWRLSGDPSTGALGVTTGLLAADPGPPVLDRTALLDQSMLINQEDVGLSVHAHHAHRICVHVPDGTAEQVEKVDTVVQRERPAHVLARTCSVSHTTAIPTEVGVDALPPSGPPGLSNDQAFDAAIDGPGLRLGTARLPEPSTSHNGPGTTPAAKGRS
jgi:phage tail-like protein